MQPAQTPTTEELLVDAKLGNKTAINELFERQSDSLYRLIQRRLDHKIRRRISVSDVVQNVLIDANRRLQKYLDDPVMPFRLWLRQIAKDRMIDAYRRHRGSAKRSVDREQNLAALRGYDDSHADLMPTLADSTKSPEENALREEWAEQIQDSIKLLSERHAEIIMLRNYKGLSNLDISHLLNLSEPAASMRYLRAIRRLREVISADHPAEQT